MPRIAGNMGEWSELYVFLELLASGKLYAADEKLKKMENVYFPILKILRNEETNKNSEYVISDNKKVELFINGQKIKSIDRSLISKHALTLFTRIKQSGERAFEIDEAEQIMHDVDCKKIKAPSTDKTDIKMQLLDINTGYSPICGFSIKSELGSAPTLLNASGATNIQFKITGITDADKEYINAIDTKNKIIARIAELNKKGIISFSKIKNNIFLQNLMLIDSCMDDIVASAILYEFSTGEKNCRKLVDALEKNNPLGYPKSGYYEYKFKKLLCSIALGMTAGKEWNGKDEANGGYIIVTTSGDILAYHIYNRDYFEDYLLNNTYFDRPSTSRHNYAYIYKEHGEYYIDFNLQIRFIK